MESFAALAKNAVAKGWQVWLLGSDKDSSVANQIADIVGSKHCYSLAGKTSLQQVMHLLAQADRAVSNDSGLMHIAAALKKEVFSIWGNTIPEFGMYPYQTKFTILENKGLLFHL